MAKKAATAAEKLHMDKITRCGCVVCLNEGYGQTRKEDTGVHHKKGGNGSKRAGHKETLPLCGPHHQTGGYGVAFHAGQEEWERRHGTEDELLAQLSQMIGE
jgi:hypothetical protein